MRGTGKLSSRCNVSVMIDVVIVVVGIILDPAPPHSSVPIVVNSVGRT